MVRGQLMKLNKPRTTRFKKNGNTSFFMLCFLVQLNLHGGPTLKRQKVL